MRRNNNGYPHWNCRSAIGSHYKFALNHQLGERPLHGHGPEPSLRVGRKAWSTPLTDDKDPEVMERYRFSWDRCVSLGFFLAVRPSVVLEPRGIDLQHGGLRFPRSRISLCPLSRCDSQTVRGSLHIRQLSSPDMRENKV